MLYNKVPTDLKFVEREKEVSKFWKEHHIFEKSIEEREGCPEYMFYDGPPTANGKPHVGHVVTRAIKDMIPRYRTMKGYQVPRKAGWDTHRSSSMELSHLSSAVRQMSGNIRVCGKNFPRPLVSGLIWKIHM